jgi:hypothetical protein
VGAEGTALDGPSSRLIQSFTFAMRASQSDMRAFERESNLSRGGFAAESSSFADVFDGQQIVGVYYPSHHEWESSIDI